MCPYYDARNGRCEISGSSYGAGTAFSDGDCRDSEYWKRCPNYENRASYGK